MKATSMTSPSLTPGQHFGPAPIDPALRSELDRVHALGWDTTSTATYEAMQLADVGPDDLRRWAA